MNMQEAGILFKEYRKKAHLSQSEIASKLGMSRSTISLIETGAIGEIGIRKFSLACDMLGLLVQVVPTRAPTWNELQESASEIQRLALQRADKMVKIKTSKLKI